MYVRFLNFLHAEPHPAKPEVCIRPHADAVRRPGSNRAGNVDRCKEISGASRKSLALRVAFEDTLHLPTTAYENSPSNTTRIGTKFSRPGLPKFRKG